MSLAVWMGGVTSELARLVRGDGSYKELRDLAGVEPSIDVISGTSAGGINGAFLATALVHNSDMSPLRDLWIESGSFLQLLRDPLADSQPDSLLRGDEYFLGKLRSAFRQLVGPHKATPNDVPIDLSLTATRLEGLSRQLADDFGTRIVDVSHRMLFEFRRGPGVVPDDFADEQLVDRLALAARTTASFPGAFEPSFIPMSDSDIRRQGLGTGTITHPNMKAVAKHDHPGGPAGAVDGPLLAVDGGVLDNKPIEAVLKGIERQRHRGSFRRALLSIVPDPGETADGDTSSATPMLSDVIVKSLITIPRNETVMSELREAREENRRAEEALNVRLALGSTLRETDLESLATKLLPAYRQVRTDRSLRFVIERISQALGRETGTGLPYRGLREVLHERMTAVGPPWVPPESESFGSSWNFEPATWAWGYRPVEEGLALTGIALRWIEEHDPGIDPAPDIADLWEGFYAIAGEGRDTHSWSAAGAQLAPDGVIPSGFVEEAYAGWADEDVRLPEIRNLELPRYMPRRSASAWLAWATASNLAALSATARAHGFMDDSRVASLLDLLAPRGAEPDEVVRRLLCFHVIKASFGRAAAAPREVVEIMQISGATESPFPNRSIPVGDKLAGMKLGHFGAFYKRSWRANDWMHGRLDAAMRITQLLLNPADLMARYESRAEAIEQLRVFCHGGDDEPLASEWIESDVVAELAFLDGALEDLPSDIPHTVAAVARRLQVDIAAEELGAIAIAAERDGREGRRSGSQSDEYLSAYKAATGQGSSPAQQASLNPAQAIDLLHKCHIGQEDFASDVGTDRLAQVASTTLAVGTAALQSRTSGLRGFRFVLRLLRAPVVILYLLVRNAATENRAGSALNAVAATFGLTVVVLSLFFVEVGPLLPFAWALVAAAILALLVRTRWPLLVLGLLILGGAIAAGVRMQGQADTLAAIRPYVLVGGFLLVISFLRWPWTPARRKRRRQLGARVDVDLRDRLHRSARDYLEEQRIELDDPDYAQVERKITRMLKKI